MKFKYIIWDWNGTLLNDAHLCRTVMNGLLSRRHLPLMTRQRYQSIFDFPVSVYYQRLGFDFSSDTFEALGTEFIAEYERYRSTCHLQKGARALIAGLHKHRIKQAILSAYRHDTLVSLLQEKNLAHYFDWIAGAVDHYAHGKEFQGKRLLEQINPPPGQTLLIGDTIHDFEVARAIGISSVLVHGRHQSMERLVACDCPVFDNLVELKNWLMETH